MKPELTKGIFEAIQSTGVVYNLFVMYVKDFSYFAISG